MQVLMCRMHPRLFWHALQAVLEAACKTLCKRRHQAASGCLPDRGSFACLAQGDSARSRLLRERRGLGHARRAGFGYHSSREAGGEVVVMVVLRRSGVVAASSASTIVVSGDMHLSAMSMSMFFC